MNYAKVYNIIIHLKKSKNKTIHINFATTKLLFIANDLRIYVHTERKCRGLNKKTNMAIKYLFRI